MNKKTINKPVDFNALRKTYEDRKSWYETYQLTDHTEYKKITEWLNTHNEQGETCNESKFKCSC